MTGRLCGCGAPLDARDGRCSACGVRPPVRRRRAGRLPRIKLKAALVAFGVVAGLASAASLADLVRERRARAVQPWRAHDEAQRLKKAGDARGARDVLVEATRRATPDAKAWFSLALLDREQGLAPETCAEEARRCVEIDAKLVDAWIFLAGEELRRGRVDAAVAAAQTAARDAPPKSPARRLLGELLLRKSPVDAARAVGLLTRAHEETPGDPTAALLLAEAWIRDRGGLPPGERPAAMQSAFTDASRVLDDAGAAARRDAKTSVSAAWVAEALGRHDRALAEADAALASVPRERGGLVAELRAVRGRALFALGRPAEGIAAFSDALSGTPTWPTVSQVADFLFLSAQDDLWDRVVSPRALAADSTGALHAGRAALRLAQGRLDDAAADAESAARAAPAASAYALLLGDARRARGDVAGAVSAYREAERLDPSDAAPTARRAAALADPRLRADAAALEAAATEASARADAAPGERASLLAAVGALRLAQGRRDDARAALAAAAEAAASRADAWLFVGDAWAGSPLVEDQDRAADAYARGRRLRPFDAQFALREAGARLAAGRAAQARPLCDAVLARRPDAAALDLRARALADLNRWPEAAADLAALVEKRPDDDAALLRRVEAAYRAGDAASARSAASARAERLSPEARARLAAMRRALDPAAAGAADVVPPLLDAEIRLREGDRDGCARLAKSRLADDPRDGDAVALLALAVCEDGAGGAAELRAAAARAGDAMSPRAASVVEACARFADGRSDASAAFASLRAAAPDDPALRRLHAWSLLRGGAPAAGLAEIRAAAASASASDLVRRDAAEAMREAARADADPASAERSLREALALSPSPAVVDDLCVVLLRAGRPAPAASEAARALGRGGLDAEWATRLAYRAAQASLAAGDTADALSRLAALPPAESASAQAATLRGAALLRDRRAADAATELERAWRADPDDDAAFVVYLEAALAGDRAQDALRAVEERRRVAHGDGRRVAAAAALAFARHGRLDDAAAGAKDACDAAPGDVGAARLAASLAGRRGDAAGAVAVARRCADAAPEAAKRAARLLLGETLEQFAGAHDDARAEATRVLADAAASAEERLAARLLVAEATLGASDAHAAGELAAAVVAELTRSGATPSARSAEFEGRCRFVLAAAAWARRDETTAESELTRCLALDPDHAAAANDLAWILSKRPENAKRAAELVRRATALAPSRPEFWDTRGVCAAALGETKESEDCLRRAIDGYGLRGAAAARPRAESMLRLASLLAQTSRVEEGRALAREVASMDVPWSVRSEARRVAEGR